MIGRRLLSSAGLSAVLLFCCGGAGAITGTWSGSLRDENGNVEQITFMFSERDRLILQVGTRSGPRNIELNQVGQSSEWLLPGSGWARGRITQLAASADRFQATVVTYSEWPVATGRLAQKEQEIQYSFALQGGSIVTQISVANLTHHAGGGVGLSSSQGRTVLRGQLRRSG